MTILFYMRYRSSIMPPSPTPVWKDAATERKKYLERLKKKKKKLNEEETLLLTILDLLDEE